EQPAYRQIYDQIRLAILAGRLRPGSRLPSSRGLAAELGVSRNTVLSAFDMLVNEGYTEGGVGSGTRVSAVLPDDLLSARGAKPETRPEREAAGPALRISGLAARLD
ncbi:MAG: winged helix-turn-helix domain-containing protein, partial [Rhodospirillaceae bacterium]